MENELSFGEDCVIKLEDLGEFKDYSETLERLKERLEGMKGLGKKVVPEELWDIVDSDPEDTFFLPDFQAVLGMMASIDWSPLLTEAQYLKIIGFYLQIIEEAFLSFTFSEETIDSLTTQIAASQLSGLKIQRLLMKLMFKLSDKVMYIEEFERMKAYWEMVKEEELFSSYEKEKVDNIGAVYADCCEKFLRNREIRKQLQSSKEKPFLGLKLSIWQRNKDQF